MEPVAAEPAAVEPVTRVAVRYSDDRSALELAGYGQASEIGREQGGEDSDSLRSELGRTPTCDAVVFARLDRTAATCSDDAHLVALAVVLLGEAPPRPRGSRPGRPLDT